MKGLVVPLFNKEKYIVECLLSIANQQYQNWECIIVDDGSTDQSVLEVEKVITSVPGNWKILRKANGGPSSARNFGIRMAQGEFIAFLDSDDIWLPNKLIEQVAYFKENPDCQLSLTDYIIQPGIGSHIRAIRSSKSSRLLSNWLSMRGFGGLVESTGLVRRSTFLSNTYFDEDLGTGEGLDFMFKVNSLGKFIVVPKFLTIYRLSEGQLHKNEELVRVNARTLAERYVSASSGLQKVIESQNAYFELSSLRNAPKKQLLAELTRKAGSLDFKLFSMATAIVIRNIRANIISSFEHLNKMAG
jgi:glycosyltransferase involved in cell wall biosynthesis